MNRIQWNVRHTAAPNELLAARLLNVLSLQISNFQDSSLELQGLLFEDMSNSQHPSSIGSNIFDAEGIFILPDGLGNSIVCVGTEARLYAVRSSILHSNQSLELNMAEHGKFYNGPTELHKQ